MPRCHFLLRHLFLFILLLSPWLLPCGCAAGSSRSLLSNPEPSKEPKKFGISKLPIETNRTEFVVDRTGKVFLMQLPDNKPIWSFSSGSPIYSSYHTPINITENATEITTSPFLTENMNNSMVTTDYTRWEDLLKRKPLATDDGVTVGSNTTTIYVVDGMSGRLIQGYKSTHSSGHDNNTNAVVKVKPTSIGNSDKLELRIRRKDTKLEHFDKITGKLVWNATVSYFRVALLCDSSLNSGKNLGPKIRNGVYMPLLCGGQTKKISTPVESKLFVKVPRDQTMMSDIVYEAEHHTNKEIRMLQEQDRRNVFGTYFSWVPVKLLALLCFLGVVVSVFVQRFSSKDVDSTLKSGTSKKKKNRRSGKDGSNGKRDTQSELDHIEGGQKLLGFNNHLIGAAEGRKIGKLFVSSKEIAKGSNGTVLFEGIYEGRAVAVKRLVQSHHEFAFKEIQNLIASDQHPNIIRWYGVEYDRDFVYLSLERCTCSLNDLINTNLNYAMRNVFGNIEFNEAAGYNIQFGSLEGIIKENNLWKVGGYPSSIMLKLMRDIVSGLVHLHELGIVHRDLKPQNILINKGITLSAKLSDMGISKRLSGGMLSLGRLATGCGSSGWQAPEQLLRGRQTRAVDMFSLGCVLFYSITGCKHPFGDELERDVNIVKNKVDLFLVEHVPEALDLISRLLNPNPDLRPSAAEVLLHPMFWNSDMRLSFLRDASDRVELENRVVDSEVLTAMENTAPVAIGAKWDEKLEPNFLTEIRRYRRYKYDSIRDLLRVIRNKLNHYREFPQEVQELIGTVPEGYYEYFAVRFPKLLIEVYKVIYVHCREEEVFSKYFKCNII